MRAKRCCAAAASRYASGSGALAMTAARGIRDDLSRSGFFQAAPLLTFQATGRLTRLLAKLRLIPIGCGSTLPAAENSRRPTLPTSAASGEGTLSGERVERRLAAI